jgi:type I restriction enzyme S subunit
VAIVPEALRHANITQDTARARVRSNYSSRYLYLALQSNEVQNQISLHTIGQAVKGINIRDVKNIAIPFPPSIAEQEAIASALSDADALIESLEQLLGKKRQIKQGTMQELLTGKKRLPGFRGAWQAKQLGSCLQARPDYGINAAAVPFSDRLPRYIRITDITDQGRYYPDPPVSVRSPFAEQFLLNDGDVVFARTGASVGKAYRYLTADGPLVFAGFLIRVRPNPAVLSSAYLAAYVTTMPYWRWVRLMSMRSGQPGINGNEYTQLPISLPSIDEQSAITAIFSDMDAEIAALEANLAKVRQIKQGMMQELLTGRIRLV